MAGDRQLGHPARLWDLRLEDLIYRARRIAGRNLTVDEWQQYFLGEEYRSTFEDYPAGTGVDD